MSQKNIFADRVINISLVGGLVRMELGVLEPPMSESETTRVISTDRLVMPLEGFLAAFKLQEGAVKELIARDTKLKADAVAGTQAKN